MIDFYFPVASVLFLFFKQETIVLQSYVCSVGTQNSYLKFGKDRGMQSFGQILICFYSLEQNLGIETTQPDSAYGFCVQRC